MDADERNRKDTKRSEVCFWDLNPDETHLEILQETMRLIVLMVFVYLVMIKGIFHSFSWNSKGEVLKNKNAYLFHTMKVDWGPELSRKRKRAS